MDLHLRVQFSPVAGHSEQSETQLHEGNQVREGNLARKT